MSNQYSSRTLRPIVEQDFDPLDKDHLDAAMCLLLKNRLHPTLRFRVEYPFLSVREMMLIKMSVAHAEKTTGVDYDCSQMFAGPKGGLLNKLADSVVHSRPTSQSLQPATNPEVERRGGSGLEAFISGLPDLIPFLPRGASDNLHRVGGTA